MIRENLSGVVSSIGRNNFTPSNNIQVGRVYGIVTTENTPSPSLFQKAGGYNGLGTIFYLDYNQAKNVTGSIDENFLSSCKLAKPKDPQSQFYPLKYELVLLEDAPSPISQVSNTANQKYYSILNLWNNGQQNSQPAGEEDSLGSTFSENPNIKPLIAYQGDNILGGRQGSSLRFSTTTRSRTNPNEWSEIGNEIDPITVLTNGLAYNPNQGFYVERINEDSSSIYLTSKQKIPLQTDKNGTLNNLTNPLNVPDYFNSQFIVNGDRIVLNSKKDEIMIFAKTNVEINTKNIINLNADNRVHLNSNQVFLGSYNTNLTFPMQPVLLGYETIRLFEHLQETLTRLSFYLSTVVSTSEGSPILGLNTAGKELVNDMKKMCDLLEKIPSQKVFVS